MRPPRAWQVYVTYLQLPPERAAQFWQALCRSRWSECMGVRQVFTFYGQLLPGFDPTGLARRAATPQKMVETLELLCTQQLLSRDTTSTIEEYILKRCRPDGRWQ
jgi:hypothetical protein